jgi:hypothetical protein
MRRIRILMSIPLACLVSAAWSQAQAGPKPEFTTIDVPGAAATLAFANNPAGAIAGTYLAPPDFSFQGFLRAKDGTISTFDAPDAGTFYPEGTLGQSINPAGAIAGNYADAGNVNHGFLRAPDGTITEFDVPGAGTGSGQGTATQFGVSINPAGTISGTYTDAGNVIHGFVRASDGTITTFDAPGAGTAASQGTGVGGSDGINPAGAIAGFYIDASGVYHDLLRDSDGKITEFDPPGVGTAAGQGSAGGAINQESTIVGDLHDKNNVLHGFVRTRNGAITTFDVPGVGGPGIGNGINPAGTITGDYPDAGNVNHGYVRDPDGTITQFDAPGAGTASGQGTFAQTINPAGEITGYYIDASGLYHGYVRTK